jgi:conjugative transposon TraM protein
MKNTTRYPSKHLKQKKFLLVFPLLVLPFTTFLFWSLGGGRGDELRAQSKVSLPGLNVELPEAKLKNDNDLTKLSFYEQADRDSLKFKDLAKNDPYWKSGLVNNNEDERSSVFNNPANYNSRSSVIKNFKDPNEEKIYSKIEQLNKQLNKSSVVTKSQPPSYNARSISSNNPTSTAGNDVDRLEGLMKSIQENREEDPQMKQLNEVVQKIAELQTSEKSKVGKREQQGQPKTKTLQAGSDASQQDKEVNDAFISDEKEQTAFYSSDNMSQSVTQNSILAVVHETQTLASGSVIKLRLMQDIFVEGREISKGELIYGLCELNNERLAIRIPSVAYNNNILPVNLIAFDIDGLEGIYVPGAMTRDVAKQSADNAIQSVELVGLDRSLRAQATGAGIGAIKSLLSKKVRQVKVTVKAGYQLILKNQHESDQ